MSRQWISLCVASALVFGSIGASASTVAAPPAQTQSIVAKNEPPLKPGGAAGIRQAQGIEDVDVWVISGLILGAIIWVLVGNDNHNTESTNATD